MRLLAQPGVASEVSDVGTVVRRPSRWIVEQIDKLMTTATNLSVSAVTVALGLFVANT